MSKFLSLLQVFGFLLLPLSAQSATNLIDSSCSWRNDCQPICPLDSSLEVSHSREPLDTVSSLVVPSLAAFLPQVTAMAFTGWVAKNRQLGLDVYRGIRCFELGVRGLQRLYDYSSSQGKADSELAVAKSKDLSLNQDMFGYLLADTIVQTTFSEMRKDLLVHHIMGLTLWGSTLFYGVFPDIIAINSAVEILSSLKGIEYSINNKFFGDRSLLRNQRILKTAYAFRLAVILGIRYPMWLWVDWNVPNERYDQLGLFGWSLYRTLNVGILALESLWLYQTAKTFSRLRFF